MATQVKIPNDMMPSVIEMLTDKVTKLQDQLKTIEAKHDSAQYNLAELKNQVEALKKENKRLYGMIEHYDDNIEVNCDDF